MSLQQGQRSNSVGDLTQPAKLVLIYIVIKFDNQWITGTEVIDQTSISTTKGRSSQQQTF